jgi:hypothetical protein
MYITKTFKDDEHSDAHTQAVKYMQIHVYLRLSKGPSSLYNEYMFVCMFGWESEFKESAIRMHVHAGAQACPVARYAHVLVPFQQRRKGHLF